MDVHRFDAFARTLASGTSRRAFLRNLTRSGAGVFAGLGVVRSTSAAMQPTGSGSGTAGQNGCEPTSCPAGRVFSETECACVCDVVCEPNYWLDPATCNCYCTLSDFYVCPRPDQVYDDDACRCVCAIEDCPSDAVLDTEGCFCYCPDTIVCEPGEVMNPDTCECYCDRTCEWPLVLDDCECVCGIVECDPGFIYDETACTCTCERNDCQAPLTLDAKTCQCVCQEDQTCASPKIFAEDACRCICPPEIRCTRGKVVDPETCGCICPLEDPCPPGQKMNPDSCLCDECSGPVVCAAPKVQDPAACGCICPPEEACPAHLTKDPETCQCVCPPGTGLCKDACVAPCLPTEAYNDACQCEPIVCPPDRVLTCTCACPQGMAECDGNCLPACGPNQVFDAACRCACRPNISCAEGWKLDSATCECVCGLTTCPAGKELDQQACQCICPRNQSCLTGQTLNPDTCKCECGPEPCPPGKIKNKACRCECPRNIACRQGETLDPATCACRCAPGSLIETIRVPCRGGTVTSTTVLQAGVAYRMRASGTCILGPHLSGDAEFAYQTLNHADPRYLMDACGGTINANLGVGINSPVVDGTKTPNWGAYNLNHVYTTTFTGAGATIDLNYHDCFSNDNQGEITIEIFCPGTPTGGTPGTGTANPICNNTCPSGKTLDPQTCACVCPATDCAAPFQLDPATCGCVCPPNISCQHGESVDPTTCTCRCDPGATLETVTVPCSGASVLSATSLQAGVTYVLRASGTCTIGYVRPPTPDADAEYAFNPANPTTPGWDRCPGSTDLGIGIDDATFDGTKTPNWGAYSPTHIYTIGFTGTGAPISVNYHDCVHKDNVGSLQVEIICPGAPSGEPTDTGDDNSSG